MTLNAAYAAMAALFCEAPNVSTASVSALLHFDGVNNSTTLTDATNRHIWTPHGNAKLTSYPYAQICFSQWDGTQYISCLMNSDGTNVRPLAAAGGAGASHSNQTTNMWSPDGSLTLGYPGGPTPPGIYTINADGTGLTRLSSASSGQDAFPSWSPDGTKIAFGYWANYPNGNPILWDIMTMSTDGSHRTTILANNGVDVNTEPRWSPDGSKIVFEKGVSGGNSQIYTMNADGSNPQILINDPSNMYGDAIYSADGHLTFAIAVGGGGPSPLCNVYKCNSDGTNVTKLTFFNPPREGQDESWSGDSKYVAFVYDEVSGVAQGPGPTGWVAIVRADGSGEWWNTGVNAPPNGGQPRWRPGSVGSGQAKFGGASLYLDGSVGTYVSGDATSDFAFGTSAFTYDFWCYISDLSAGPTLVNFGAMRLYVTASGVVNLWANNNNQLFSNPVITTNTWNHFAVTRANSVTNLFVNGTKCLGDLAMDGTGNYVDNNNYTISPNMPQLGYDGSSTYLHGYIDEFRIVKNKAVWTSNFTPPTLPYTS
jgi:Tol biopolymer transport system component